MSLKTTGFLDRDPSVSTLDEIFQGIWQELASAAGQLGHPWSHVSIATISAQAPQQRLMILREVVAPASKLVFHTDRRSRKIRQLEESPAVSGLTYDSRTRIQLTFQATAFIHQQNHVSDDHWKRVSLQSRRNYLGMRPPGEIAVGASTNFPDAIRSGGLTEATTLPGRENFAVLELVLTELELLWLRDAGNLRVRFQQSDAVWEQHWIEP